MIRFPCPISNGTFGSERDPAIHKETLTILAPFELAGEKITWYNVKAMWMFVDRNTMYEKKIAAHQPKPCMDGTLAGKLRDMQQHQQQQPQQHDDDDEMQIDHHDDDEQVQQLQAQVASKLRIRQMKKAAKKHVDAAKKQVIADRRLRLEAEQKADATKKQLDAARHLRLEAEREAREAKEVAECLRLQLREAEHQRQQVQKQQQQQQLLGVASAATVPPQPPQVVHATAAVQHPAQPPPQLKQAPHDPQDDIGDVGQHKQAARGTVGTMGALSPSDDSASFLDSQSHGDEDDDEDDDEEDSVTSSGAMARAEGQRLLDLAFLADASRTAEKYRTKYRKSDRLAVHLSPEDCKLAYVRKDQDSPKRKATLVMEDE